MPFLNSIDNRLASLLDPKFKHKWIEDGVEKEAMHMPQAHGQCEEDSSSISTDDENESLAKKPRLFGFIAAGSKKRKPSNSVKEVERYFEEEIIQFDEDPLMYWKKKSELPSLAALAKKYGGLTAASAPSERLFSIAGNFYTARRNLLGTDTFRNLMFMKCNSNTYDKVKL